MNPKILVTDTLFIFEEHVRQMENAGFDIVRLEEPNASEETLIHALKGKVGYILGGIETVTEKVIKSTDSLKAISFTGAGYTEFIPGHEAAREKGIAITAAKGANASAVAELSIIMCLMATRHISEITNPAGAAFLTTKGASESTLGVVGYGDIGSRVAALGVNLGYSVLVATRKKINGLPANVRQVDIETLVSESDVVSLHVDKENGTNVLNQDLVAKIPKGAAIVNAAFIHSFDQKAVAERLLSGDLRLLTDQKLEIEEQFPIGALVQTNMQSGFNTQQALKAVSDQTTNSILNILETGEDDYRVV